MRKYLWFRAFVCAGLVSLAASANATIPDGRRLAPAGFTIPVEGFASAHALSPDGKWLAVLSQDAGALDIISTERSVLTDRIPIPAATGLTWTTDGLYVTRGYSGTVARYSYDGPKLVLTKRPDLRHARRDAL